MKNRNEDEKTQLRGVHAGINWASREGRPDAASAASIFASRFPDVTVMDIKRANKEVARLKATPVTIRILPIPLESRITVILEDSSHDTSC